MSKYLAVLVSVLICAACKTGPSQSDAQVEIAFKSKCRDDGKKYASEWKAAHPSGVASGGYSELTTLGGWLAVDEFAYNKRLNTCLWSGEYNGAHGALGTWHVKLIVDVYANKPLIQFAESDGKQVGIVSGAAFEKKKA